MIELIGFLCNFSSDFSIPIRISLIWIPVLEHRMPRAPPQLSPGAVMFCSAHSSALHIRVSVEAPCGARSYLNVQRSEPKSSLLPTLIYTGMEFIACSGSALL